MAFEAHIRTARKQYRCASSPDRICNKAITAGDLYFVYTHILPNQYTSRRYCLECARFSHPKLLDQALTQIKNKRNQKTASAKVGRVKFLNTKANEFRKSATTSETFFWETIRSAKLGVRFQQQAVLHGYVVDFWCAQAQLVVELDGRRHRLKQEADQKRDEIMKAHGIRVLRFPSSIVFSDVHFILERIKEVLTTKDTKDKPG